MRKGNLKCNIWNTFFHKDRYHMAHLQRQREQREIVIVEKSYSQ